MIHRSSEEWINGRYCETYIQSTITSITPCGTRQRYFTQFYHGRGLNASKENDFSGGKYIALSQGNRYRGKFTYGSTLRRESKGHCYLPSLYPPPTWLRGKIFFHRYFPASLVLFPQDNRYLSTDLFFRHRRFFPFCPKLTNSSRIDHYPWWIETSIKIIHPSEQRSSNMFYTDILRNGIAPVSRGINARHETQNVIAVPRARPLRRRNLRFCAINVQQRLVFHVNCIYILYNLIRIFEPFISRLSLYCKRKSIKPSKYATIKIKDGFLEYNSSSLSLYFNIGCFWKLEYVSLSYIVLKS